MTLQLLACGKTNVLQTTTTATNCIYQFCGLLPSGYQVQVLTPNGWVLTTQT